MRPRRIWDRVYYIKDKKLHNSKYLTVAIMAPTICPCRILKVSRKLCNLQTKTRVKIKILNKKNNQLRIKMNNPKYKMSKSNNKIDR